MIAFAVFLVLSTVGAAAPVTAEGSDCSACGDVNCDGVADAIDALLVSQQTADLRGDLPCSLAADVSNDGSTDLMDAVIIGRFAVGAGPAPACPPVITAVSPEIVDAAGRKLVRVTGAHFSPGASVALDRSFVEGTYLDCSNLEATVPRLRPGQVEVVVLNPDGRFSHRPAQLMVKGAFADVSEERGLVFVPRRGADLLPTAGGVAVIDYDQDGDWDIFVPNHDGPAGLFRNRGDGSFENVAATAGVEDLGGQGNGACAADYDNDGDVDLYVTNFGPNRFFRNAGNGTFSDVAAAAGVADSNRGTGCSWGDFDRDGHLDLYVANHLDESDRRVFITRQFGPARRPDRLFRNRGDGRFDDVTALLGPANLVTGAGFGASFLDYDNDGDADLYLVNDFGREIQPNVLWRNDGPMGASWGFTDVSTTSRTNLAMYGMGLAVGDYDTDGFFDLYITNIGRNALLRGRGDGTYEDRTDEAHVGRELLGQEFSIGWGNASLDYDNDSNLDLYLVAGYLDSDPLINDPRQPNALFRNRGNGTFEDVSEISGADDNGIGRGLAVADFNQDGFLDMVVVNLGQGLVLLENTARTPGHWLELHLVGTRSNRDAVGARVTATTGARRQIREVIAGGSSMSQSAGDIHFGLGASSSVDVLQIRWPSGVVQTLNQVAANQRLILSEP